MKPVVNNGDTGMSMEVVVTIVGKLVYFKYLRDV